MTKTKKTKKTTAACNTNRCGNTKAKTRTNPSTQRGNIIRSLTDILGESVPTRSKMEILAMARMSVNTSRYHVLDTVGRTKNVVLQPRYHNVRNKQGQFVSKK